jgi:hypothetical protein
MVAETRAPPDGWLSAEIAGILSVSSTLELLTWWLRQKPPLPIEHIAEIHERIVISPIMNAQDNPRRPSAAPRRSGKAPRTASRTPRRSG